MACQQSATPLSDTTISIPAAEGHTKDGDNIDNKEDPGLQRAQWLRAAILGANDGLLSTTLLMLGVGAAQEDRQTMVLSGLAGTIAGACSMAVGEYVSVSTQREIEDAARSRRDTKKKLDNLKEGSQAVPISKIQASAIVSSPARSPMMKVMAEQKKEGHEEEDYVDNPLPNPVKAAAASWLSFICGSIVPLVSTILIGARGLGTRIVTLALVTSVALVIFGGVGAYLGGSRLRVAATRVLLGGWMAMAITYGILKPFDNDHDNKN